MDRRESEAMDSHIVGDQDQYLLGGEEPEEPECTCGPHPWSYDGPALDAVAPLPLRSECAVHGDGEWGPATQQVREPETGSTTTVYGRWMSLYNRQILRGEPRVGSGLHQRKVIRHTPTYNPDGTVTMDAQYAVEMRTF